MKNIWLRTRNHITHFLETSGQRSFSLAALRFRLRGHGRSFSIFTHTTEKERVLLYSLALRLPRNNCMVEIGSYLGASSCFLAAAASENGGRLYCVDTWLNEAMTEGTRDTYKEFTSNTQAYQHLIVPIRQRSEEAAMGFITPIDLLFIDGDHSYEAVVRDLNSWLPKLRQGGWLVMHDSRYKEGVKRAVQEIVLPLQIDKPQVLPNLYAARVDWKNNQS